MNQLASPETEWKDRSEGMHSSRFNKQTQFPTTPPEDSRTAAGRSGKRGVRREETVNDYEKSP